MHSYTVCRVTIISNLYSLALYCKQKTFIWSKYVLSNISDLLFIGKEDAGRRHFLLIWFCIICTLCFIHNCQFHKNILLFILKFKYLGTTIRNQNSIQEEIKSRLKPGDACYDSVQNILSSSLLSKNLKIKIYGTITLPVWV